MTGTVTTPVGGASVGTTPTTGLSVTTPVVGVTAGASPSIGLTVGASVPPAKVGTGVNASTQPPSASTSVGAGTAPASGSASAGASDNGNPPLTPVGQVWKSWVTLLPPFLQGVLPAICPQVTLVKNAECQLPPLNPIIKSILAATGGLPLWSIAPGILLLLAGVAARRRRIRQAERELAAP